MGACQEHLSLWHASHPTSQLVLPEEQAKLGSAKAGPRLAISNLPAEGPPHACTYCPLELWGKLWVLFLPSSPALLVMSLLAYFFNLFKMLFLGVFPSSQRS